ncbi:PQQ-binding-like beta-propeller repeat protein [Streptomyces sp. NPDC048172]|uniref:serine/threonine-protein kinase n=1 Tax=Streptomyces sp. NPDC048172 TaxID=3365505 RepID=UPI003719935F
MAFPLTHDDPQRLGPFVLVARLGSGGMGTVYLGRSPRGRTVALKTMHAEFAERPDFRTRFRLETDAARVIGDLHGARVVDADPLAEVPWLATEYVLGPPLDEAVALCGPLPEDAVRALGAGLCEALAQLHGTGVVHRDLKPSNILVTATGPKVIDFGIARAEGDDRLTRTGSAAGTPAFMSPEQATGAEHPPAGDVFALAGVLVFAASGHGPFGGGQAADLLYRVRYAEPDLSGVPADLAGVLLRCLDKDPAARPGTGELRTLLDRDDSSPFAARLPGVLHAEILRRGEAVWDVEYQRLPPPLPDTGPEEPATTRTPGARSGPGRRALLLGSGAVAVAAAGGGAWFALRPGDGPGPSAKKPDGPKAAPTAPGGAPKEKWKLKFAGLTRGSLLVAGDYLTYSANSGFGTIDVRSGKESGTTSELDQSGDVFTQGGELYAANLGKVLQADPKTCSFREPAITDFRKLGLTGDAQLVGVADGVLYLSGTSEGGSKEKGKKGKKGGEDDKAGREEWLAVDSGSGKIRWRRKGVIRVPATPAGDKVVFSDETTLLAVDARTGRKKWKLHFPDHPGLKNVEATVRAHSGPFLFVGDRRLVAVRVADGKVAWTFGEGRENSGEDEGNWRYGVPVVDGDLLYLLERGTGLIALDRRSGKLRWEMKADWITGLDPGLAEAVKGRELLYVSGSGTQWVRAIDLKRRREVWTYQGPGDSGNVALRAHKRGDRLLAVGQSYLVALPLQ